MEQNLNVQHSLFVKLREEHAQIVKMMDLLDHGDLQFQKIMELWVFAELTHHIKEEKLLFAAVASKPRLKEGGPMCSFYFDTHRNLNPIERIQALLSEQIPIEAHQQLFYDLNLPLRIPTDEHRAGKAVLHRLIMQYDSISNSDRKSLLDEYRLIQQTHLKKEETCLFHLCANILTVAEADQILLAW